MHMNPIENKRILLLCPNFYDYDLILRDELLKLGAKDVYLKNARYFSSSIREWESFNFRSFILHPFERRKWTNNFIKEIRDKKFDVFLCIENACFLKYFMDFLIENNPGIKTRLFLWDTYDTQQGGFKDYRFLFDKAYTFDRDDATKYNLEYFPDFYVPVQEKSSTIFDLSFVGTANPDDTIHRLDLMDYVFKFCESNKLKTFLYLKANRPQKRTFNLFKMLKRKIWPSHYVKLLNKYKEQPWLHFEPISLQECNLKQSQAKVLLDLNHRDRQGMTINCITALANGQKLITTNKRIREESFFNPNMIYILDEDNPQLDINFWDKPFAKIELSSQKIDNWLFKILND